MLAALDAFARAPAAQAFEFVAVAPPQGALADAIRSRGLALVPLSLRQPDGHLLPRAEACNALIDVVARVQPAILHGNSLSMGRLAGAIAAKTSAQTCAHLRDIVKLSAAAAGDLNRNRLLLAVSHATCEFHASQGLHRQRIRVIHNGVDCRAFAPRPRTGSLRRELGLPDDAFLIAAIGQIALRKGHDILAAAAVLAGPRMPNAHYVVVGSRASQKPESVRFDHRFATCFADAGLGLRLHRPGYREDVAEIMNECDLLVHAARQEPLGRVLLEAAVSGLPIVATRVGGTEEILRDGDSARLVPPGDAEALAAAIVELYGNPEMRQRFAQAACADVRDRFEISESAEKTAAAWRLLAAGP